MADREDALHLEVASRTDRGVHARANVLVLEAAVPGPALLGALNGVAPDIWFTRAVPVTGEFRVRAATGRWYRYFEPDPVGRVADWSSAAARFRGLVDVRSFGRGLPAGVPCLRDLESVRVHRRGALLVVDVRGRSFVWGMVRKIISALRAHAAGTLPLEEIDAALRGERRLALPLAEPDRLVLWEVHHLVRWTTRSPPLHRAQARRLASEGRAALVRPEVLRSVPPGRLRRAKAHSATSSGF